MIKIEVARGHSGQTWFQGLREAGLRTTTSCNFIFYPEALVFLRKHVARAFKLGFYTSRQCAMQLNQTKPSPLTVLL